MNSIADIKKLEQLKTNPNLPEWLIKLLKRHDQMNRQYRRAHGKLAEAYDEFLLTIGEINAEHGTEFTMEQAIQEFEGREPEEVYEDDEDDEA